MYLYLVDGYPLEAQSLQVAIFLSIYPSMYLSIYLVDGYLLEAHSLQVAGYLSIYLTLYSRRISIGGSQVTIYLSYYLYIYASLSIGYPLEDHSLQVAILISIYLSISIYPSIYLCISI